MKITSTRLNTSNSTGLSENTVAFVMAGYNRHSIAALAGLLDQEMPDLPLSFLEGRSKLGPKVRELADRHRHVVLAFSFMTPQLPHILTAIESLDPLPCNVTLVAGGPHASGDPLGTLQLGFNVLVTGEGELTFPALLRRIFAEEPCDHFDPAQYEDLAGIAYLAPAEGNGRMRLVRNPRRDWADLNQYPLSLSSTASSPPSRSRVVAHGPAPSVRRPSSSAAVCATAASIRSCTGCDAQRRRSACTTLASSAPTASVTTRQTAALLTWNQ